MKKNYLCIQLISFKHATTGVPYTQNVIRRVDAESRHEAIGKFVDDIREITNSAINRGVIDCFTIDEVKLIP